jgi:hypothetical protein
MNHDKYNNYFYLVLYLKKLVGSQLINKKKSIVYIYIIFTTHFNLSS